MANAQWQKVREIFDSALLRQPNERRSFVNEVCGDDKTLLAEVESLLSSHDSAESFMERPAVAEVAHMIEIGPTKLEAGKCFGHYEIIKQIGAGGMGEVYLARDKKLERNVAIKILSEEVSQDESNLQRFVSEAKAASALNHPNILTIYEFGEAEDARFIVSEYIEGKTLREVSRKSRLTMPEILDISIQITSALAAAHKAHLVHRDIKPENIMVRPDGYVKVLDFGLAKLVEQKNKSIFSSEEPTVRQNLTAQGAVVGTVNYMSPEQAKGERVDERTDIFSLGVILYEMLAGKPPFEGGNAIETLGSILNKDPVPLNRETPEVPSEIERIINKALRKDREERYQTAKDLLIDLKDIRQDLQFQNQLERTASPNREETNTQILNAITADVAHTTSSAEYVANEIKSHKRSVLAILSILLLGVSGLGYWFYSSRSSLVNSKELNSIAVLPFENGSGDANLDYLSDGLSESLIDKLSQLPQLKVIARNSSFKYRGEKFDLKDVANKLSVQAIVTGRVIQRGDDLIIRIEMVDALENKQLWGETFNRRTVDAPAVQEEIARTVFEKLSLKLSGEQETQLAKRETENPQAYELMLKARFYINKRDSSGRKQAVEYLQQAIVLDPRYANAYAQLSIVYSSLIINSALDPREATSKAESAARKALELDKNLPDAHLALAILKLNAWEWAEAGREFKRAFELNPNNSGAHQLYSNYLSSIGQNELAVAESKRAKELDPLSPLINANIGITLLCARRFDEAIEHLKKILELEPNFSRAHIFLGYNYAAKGMYPEAINRYQEAIKIGSTSSSVRIYLGVSYARNGQREQAQAILKRLETSKDYVSPGELATLYAALDERDQAFVLLERAYAEHDPQLRFLNADPAFDVLRDDSRFQDLLRRVGLPQ